VVRNEILLVEDDPRLEVLRLIKEDAQMRSTPAAMLSSSADECDIAESYRVGANSYVVKSLDFDQFTESARQIGLYRLRINSQPSKG
jgi:two-component system, response regulator